MIFSVISSNEQQEHKSIKSNIENTRKFINKENEASDKLNEFKTRLLRDMTNIEKQGNFTELKKVTVVLLDESFKC